MKKNTYFKSIVILMILVIFGGCTSSTSKLSPMQKRHITTKTIEAEYENVYRATLTILQDQGYIVKNTDMASGLIVANADRKSSTTSQVMQSLFAGRIYNKGSEVEITCMVNKINNENSELRMNIREVQYGQSSAWGGSSKQNVNQVYDEKVYQNLFNEISIEVKRREALNK